jgi:hypothetical protein
MDSTLYRASLFVLYQLSLLAAIAMWPVALLTAQLGMELPAHRPVNRFGTAYENAAQA